MIKEMKIIKYTTLKECFFAFSGLGTIGQLDKTVRFVGIDGSNKEYNIGALKWINNPNINCWGWARFDTKTIHIWISPDCDTKELIGCIAHEAAHLRRPKFKDTQKEEQKALNTELDAKFAYESTMEIMNND